jgi:hypothetical protein
LAIGSANLVGGPGCTSYEPVGGQTAAHWFNNNKSCYKDLADWQARTAPSEVGYLRDPSFFNIDAALQKSFALPREGMFLVVRVESSNFTNTPIFAGPNTTLADLPTFTPNVGYSGFGALPETQSDNTRDVVVSPRITY